MTDTLERPHVAAAAPNWRSIIAMDAALGLALVAIGIALTIVWIGWLGLLVAALGIAYVTLVARRARTWHRWRRAVGLE